MVQGVSRRLQSGLTDAPSQRQGKRVARAFSQMVVRLHSSREAPTELPAAAKPDVPADPVEDAAFMPAEDPGELYADEDLSLLHEEIWWTPSASQYEQHAATSAGNSGCGPASEVCASSTWCMHVHGSLHACSGPGPARGVFGYADHTKHFVSHFRIHSTARHDSWRHACMPSCGHLMPKPVKMHVPDSYR